MTHYAKVTNGVVDTIIVAEQDFIDSLEDASSWIQTSYNTYGNAHKLGGTPLRGNYAGIGFTYDAKNDVFYAPQPYPSWTLNQVNWLWEAPIPCPKNEKQYNWNETNLSWKEMGT